MSVVDEAPALPEEPDVPEDGSCAHCGKPRRPERSSKYGALEAERDPFCSTDCCRAHYGQPVATTEVQAEQGRRAAERVKQERMSGGTRVPGTGLKIG